ncbi:hypothetical protein G4G27_18725 [Sphingomonas sp. So64.6b]|uniref:hypothetical protein n=1 Tax=Sphingomonas sp. So64.6b TaxID=2997354 RepID=UPI0016027F29|nr:hypothetical protein [Sphingomonas sp. So64.6b]QNA85788.1 hypothetical protein G4G27_18725 [Sphingomonas sp. So64.6b]
MTDIPPPRYRVVEHKGKITVTDTWAEGARPVTPTSPAPRQIGTTPITPRGRDAGMRMPGILRRSALAACAGATDANGHPIFTTAEWFDPKAPRQIALDDAGVRWLGGTLAVMLGTAITAMLLVVWLGFNALFVMVVVIMLFGRNPTRLLAWWLDQFPKLPR